MIRKSILLIIFISLSYAHSGCGNINPGKDSNSLISTSSASNWSTLLLSPGILNPDRSDPHDYIVAIHKPSLSAYEGVDFTQSPFIGWSQSADDDIVAHHFNIYEGAPQNQNTWSFTSFDSADNPSALYLDNDTLLDITDMNNTEQARWYYFDTSGVQELYEVGSTGVYYLIGQTTSTHPNGQPEALIVRLDENSGQFWYAFGYLLKDNPYEFIFYDGDLTLSNWVESAELIPSSNTINITLRIDGFGLKAAALGLETGSMVYGLNRAYLSTIDTGGGQIGTWTPSPGTSWQWQLTTPVDTNIQAEMYDLDLFENDASVVSTLKARGIKTVCYISAGSYEDWRPDKNMFPSSVLGNNYKGWPGEKWLDIRQTDLLAPVMRQRLDLCAQKGFDAVEPDNIDGYTNDTGFPLTAADQLAYNIWLAGEAHARGLSIGLKNDPAQANDLLPYYDWALTEDCFAEGWCAQMSPFISAGKAVFTAEYTDNNVDLNPLCAEAHALGLSAILKHRGLDAWRQSCD